MLRAHILDSLTPLKILRCTSVRNGSMYIHVHDGHKVSIVEHGFNYASEGVKY
jgi:ribosomal protein S4E